MFTLSVQENVHGPRFQDRAWDHLPELVELMLSIVREGLATGGTAVDEIEAQIVDVERGIVAVRLVRDTDGSLRLGGTGVPGRTLPHGYYDDVPFLRVETGTGSDGVPALLDLGRSSAT